jgi:predicted dehydrogenase
MSQNKKKPSTRREFVKSSAAAGLGVWVAGGMSRRRSLSANEEIRWACIGIDGKGSSDSDDAAAHGRVVAICDIDEVRIAKAQGEGKFPAAKVFYDFRTMLDEMGDSIDAVTVSTPDHTHAAAALKAMRMGKHCFCQKPLTHSIYEARLMAETAREQKVFTQMGNQYTASSDLRRSAALIKAGVIGRVTEVHVWTNRPVWPQGIGVALAEGDAAKDKIHWNEWIGPAAFRPYSPEIHPFKWRGLWAFGTGALGDMACHTLNMSYMALNLRNPTRVRAQTAGHDRTMYPKWSQIEFDFPELDGRPALKMFWYDGGQMPPRRLFAGCPKNEEDRNFDSGALVIGEKGKFFSPGDYGGQVEANGLVLDDKEFIHQDQITDPAVDFPRSPGHFTELANAIRGEGPAPMSNFVDYSGPLTETVLLGNLAVWTPDQTIEWNAEQMEVIGGTDEHRAIVRPEYQNGYSL